MNVYNLNRLQIRDQFQDNSAICDNIIEFVAHI